jgi:ectoine hydroxylase-related dioxygenase (phytanoyl-CoA dioxygenase family)
MFVLQRDGFQILQQAIPKPYLSLLDSVVGSELQNTRNILKEPTIRQFAAAPCLRSIVEPVLGTGCFAVRGILFNKNKDSNWKVSWHQDCVIAVGQHQDVEGWGPWSSKSGVPHVRPGADLLARMLAVRVHLDDCSEYNGALRVLPGSHEKGFMAENEIVNVDKKLEQVCPVLRGDVLLMRPLILHASSCALEANARRVLHIEFASEELPSGLDWFDRVN